MEPRLLLGLEEGVGGEVVGDDVVEGGAPLLPGAQHGGEAGEGEAEGCDPPHPRAVARSPLLLITVLLVTRAKAANHNYCTSLVFLSSET